MSENTTTSFENGASRSIKKPAYNLIPKIVLDSLARRFEVGALKYGKDNWKKGGPAFFNDTQNHLINHLWDYIEEKYDEEETPISNLEAVIWNAAALIWWEQEGKFKKE